MMPYNVYNQKRLTNIVWKCIIIKKILLKTDNNLLTLRLKNVKYHIDKLIKKKTIKKNENLNEYCSNLIKKKKKYLNTNN